MNCIIFTHKMVKNWDVSLIRKAIILSQKMTLSGVKKTQLIYYRKRQFLAKLPQTGYY